MKLVPTPGAAMVRPARVTPRATVGSGTLQRLRLLQAAALVSFALWAGIGISSAIGGRNALVQAEHTLVPEAEAAQQIETSLASMDAATVAQLQRPIGAKVEEADAAERHRTDVVRALLEAAEIGGADRVSLATIEASLGTYGQLIQHVRDLRDRNDGGQWNVYRQAVAVVDQQLIPRAATLDSAADARLRELGAQQEHLDQLAKALFLVASLCTLSILVGAQMYLSRKTRRTLNPALLAATLVCLGVTSNLVQTGSHASAAFHRVWAGAYPALRAGWQARTAAAVASDEENRAVFDAGQRQSYLREAERHREAVSTLPITLSGEQLLGALNEGRQVEGFTGFLADEIRVSPGRGEHDAAVQTLAAWLGSSFTGRQPTSSDRFERALGDALQAHQRGLTQAVEEALADQVHQELLLGLMGALGCFLVLVGFAPRIREYR